MISMLLALSFVGSCAAGPLAARLGPRTAGWVVALLPAGLFAGFLRLSTTISAGQTVTERLAWAPSLGVQLTWRLDGFAYLFCLLVTGIGTLVVIYAGAYLAERAAATGADPKSVIFEVTEGVAATNFVNVMENLARLRIKGFGISIDDYGTGYSSVQQLSRIPYTELKLDQSFVTGAGHKPTMRAILESALDLARRMKLASVAEGIEREEEWTLLKSLGCDMAQGFFIGRPMRGDLIVDWIQQFAATAPMRRAPVIRDWPEHARG